MTWYYNEEVYDPSEESLEHAVGFVYCITEKDTDMKYVGKKLFWRRIKRPPLKGKKRNRISRVESDWKDYFGSNERVKELVEEKGADAYHREILRICYSKGECSYYEAKEQFDRDVLLRKDYYNGIINCRINAKHLPSA